MHMILGKDRYS